MAKKQRLTSSTRAYMARFLANVETKRAQPFDRADEQRILTQMQSEEEAVRAQAVRQICPCRMPWEVFHRLRKAAKPLQRDPSALVRAQARHIEEDARLVASFEAQMERADEYDHRAGSEKTKVDRPWRKR